MFCEVLTGYLFSLSSSLESGLEDQWGEGQCVLSVSILVRSLSKIL